MQSICELSSFLITNRGLRWQYNNAFWHHKKKITNEVKYIREIVTFFTKFLYFSSTVSISKSLKHETSLWLKKYNRTSKQCWPRKKALGALAWPRFSYGARWKPTTNGPSSELWCSARPLLMTRVVLLVLQGKQLTTYWLICLKYIMVYERQRSRRNGKPTQSAREYFCSLMYKK